MNTHALRSLDESLAYLAWLTRSGLKPLSRWEASFTPDTEEALHQLGLQTTVVERTTLTGRSVRELLFAPSPSPLRSYVARFAGTRIKPSPQDVRLEGLLFGYPPCCVESYAAHGYLPNSLRRADQRLLFHWACPHCAATPLLLPHYRAADRACHRARREAGTSGLSALGRRLAPEGGAMTVVRLAAAAALMTLPGLPGRAAEDPDPHLQPLSVWEDPDGDGLASLEEQVLGTNETLADEDANGIPDGADLARLLAAALATLPTEPEGPQPYVVHHMTFGLENCQVCGAPINMGAMEVVNPIENQSVHVPYIGQHFLEHGSFSYVGSVHAGRVNPPLLKMVLTSQGLGHFRAEPVALDADQDGLWDVEEQSLGSDPQQPDEDGNQVVDGVDLARSVAAEIAMLPTQPAPDRPYKEEHLLRGLETCDVCGATVNMGWLVVVNPRARLYAKVPYIGLHFLEHGGLSYAGNVHGAARAEVALLVAALHAKGPSHFKPVAGDADGDGLKDDEEACFHCDPATADTDGDGVPDGFRVAREQWQAVQALPRTPGPTTHAVDHLLRGLVTCDVCGATVNMGYVEIVNPPAQRTLQLPYLSLHFMEHGSFTPSSGTRVDPVQLDAMLRPAVVITREPERVVLRWLGQAGRKYQVETAAEPSGPWVAGPMLLGDGRELSLSEPVADTTPRRFFRIAVY